MISKLMCAREYAMTTRVPFTKFGKTRMVPFDIRIDGHSVANPEIKDGWVDTLWVERAEDLYATRRGVRTLVVERSAWLQSPDVSEKPT